MVSSRIIRITPVGGDGPSLLLTTILGPDDPSIESLDVQSDLHRLHDELQRVGLKVNPRANIRKSAGSGGGWQFFGEFLVPLAQPLSLMVSAVAGAWLQSRAGRKVRIKVGDIEVEARTAEEIERLLDRVKNLEDEKSRGTKE